MMQRKFGWKPNLPHHMDMKYVMKAIPLPSMMDLRPLMSPIEDQGQLGSCVAHATCGTLEFLELQELKEGMAGKEVFPDKKFDRISRLFVYFNARVLDGNPHQDDGTQLRSAISAIQKWGICREDLWAYTPMYVNTAPSTRAYKEAASHKILNHYSLDNELLVSLKDCLASGYPFIFGISVYDSFMSEEVAQTGIVPMPAYNEEMQGGHALCCVGYDDEKSAFIVRNSWGTSWGLDGYCFLPYDYLTNADLASDFWTLRKE